MLHSKLRKKNIINQMAHIGLSISYNKMQDIQTCIAENLLEQYKLEDLVFPPSLTDRDFTVCVIDNIDQNAKSSTEESYFHGTVISVLEIVSISGRF